MIIQFACPTANIFTWLINTISFCKKNTKLCSKRNDKDHQLLNFTINFQLNNGILKLNINIFLVLLSCFDFYVLRIPNISIQYPYLKDVSNHSATDFPDSTCSRYNFIYLYAWGVTSFALHDVSCEVETAWMSFSVSNTIYRSCCRS